MKFKRTLNTAKQDFPKYMFKVITGEEFEGKVEDIPEERRRKRSIKPVTRWEGSDGGKETS